MLVNNKQKLALETIDGLINLYPYGIYFQYFRKYFDALVEAYAEVENLFIEGEMIESEDENGELVFEDTSTSEELITKSDVKKITSAINNLRDNLIK